MQRVSEAVWAQLMGAYERADAAAEEAYRAYDLEPLADNDVEPSPAQRRYEELRAVADELEDKILGVVAPSPTAAAAQLRLFALNFVSVDLAKPPEASEDREAAILRRIFAGLMNASV